MHLQLLHDTPAVAIYHDTTNDWLFADWRGELTLPLTQAGCLTLAQCHLERTYPRILNSNCDVTSMSADVPGWLAHDYLPHLGLANIEYLAWVCAPSVLLRHLAAEAVRQLVAPVVAMFDDLADGYAWLQHTRLQPLPGAGPAGEVTRQARLEQHIDALAHEVGELELAAYERVARRTATAARYA